jgi:ABC-type transporter MlaC component
VVVGNRGFYRDLHNLGFQTFGHLIDESFDLVENNQDRIQRVAQVVENLCKQDLASFLKECYTTCKYNQQHLAEIKDPIKQEFPDRFFKFLQKHFNE